MKKIYISIVSHNHEKIIKKINCLPNLSKKFTVILKSNTEEDIADYCNIHNIIHLGPTKPLGFGENNNLIFDYCKSNLEMGENDYFIILNPDVDITIESMNKLVSSMSHDNVMFSTINLYKDYNYQLHDYSIRRFPTLTDFIFSFIGFKNKTKIEKEKIASPCNVDWAAGSFLAFRVDAFERANGFNPKYFMYCEDIDICLRLKINGLNLTYYPNILAIHLAQHKNRNIFSKHFFWHLKSSMLYLIEKAKYDFKKKN
ncbi:glycosyltransferase [Xenorhabdus beddingii]|uniref:Glycosyltransferase n=1 Tax=Xenorhabdus beddingii TaxID=40578 RepID=A0A1Y2SJZ2_9GAMM|nr:glycosyltransferase family 2 protein [Xenorhabdus beddingii]OTA19169.1 glycosyltransferase [Xenorhabdus beddingii]